MSIFRHMIHQPFVFATGLAALVHSTWSLGTLFAGNEPAQFTFAWFSWVIPAFLIAFALDVGQIVTSSEIRAGSRSRRKYITFAVFALATYYLQWVYMVHHMPDLALSPGIRETWGSIVTLFRDCAIWIIPALLPLSTLLYTLSSDDMQPIEQPQAKTELEISAELEQLIPVLPAETVHVICEDCGEWSKTYDNQDSAERGLRTHQTRHCSANVAVQNGAH